MTRFLGAIFVVFVIYFLPIIPLLGASIVEENPRGQVPGKNAVESKEYRACFGNFGTLQPTLRLVDETIRDKKATNSYFPDLGLPSNIAFQFGCQYETWNFDYTISDDSFLFNKEVMIDKVLYNSIFLHQEIISFGYALPIIEKVLQGDIGLSYSQFSYQLGYFAGDSASDKTGVEKHSSLLLAQITLLYIFSKTHTIRWRYQKSLEKSNILDSNSQFSLNFLVPF